jgi:hypothetical protein
MPMPVSDEDLAAARASIEKTRRRLAKDLGMGIDADPPTDEQIAQHAQWLVFERDPDALSGDELREMLRRLREVVVEVGDHADVVVPRLRSIAEALDGRGLLAGPMIPPAERSERRAWALERIGKLGRLAWEDDVPLSMRDWFRERAVLTLRQAGDDKPSQAALRSHCANWSWSYGDTAELFAEAFPPPPEVVARHDPAVVFAGYIARRVRERSDSGLSDQAERLRRAAATMFNRWFDGPLDPVQEAARSAVRSLLAPNRDPGGPR